MSLWRWWGMRNDSTDKHRKRSEYWNIWGNKTKTTAATSSTCWTTSPSGRRRPSPGPSVTCNLSFQESHLHNLRAFINQSVRVDKEEQVPRVLSPACEEVRPQFTAVSGHAVQKQNYSLWYEARKCSPQAARKIRNQGRIEATDVNNKVQLNSE